MGTSTCSTRNRGVLSATKSTESEASSALRLCRCLVRWGSVATEGLPRRSRRASNGKLYLRTLILRAIAPLDSPKTLTGFRDLGCLPLVVLYLIGARVRSQYSTQLDLPTSPVCALVFAVAISQPYKGTLRCRGSGDSGHHPAGIPSGGA